jgi:hypothetical protein
MRTACLTLALALLTTACGDDGNTSQSTSTQTDVTTPTTTNGNTEETGQTAGTTAADMCADAVVGGKMTNYGHPCTADSECVDLIGTPDAKCLTDILMVYGLPCGYCSNLCALPDASTTFVPAAADCFMGADCVGLDNYFEGCVPQCTSNADCPREGYECRRMPTISKEGDPTYCLMTDENML